MSKMKDPAAVKRLEEGPNAMFRITRNGAPNMGKNLVVYFAYCVLVSFVTAYVARHTLTPGARWPIVFRLTGTIAIASYTLALFPESIWMWRPWNATWKSVCDSIVYGIMTGLVFAWLWPHA
jgi:hypothetical protein